MTNLFYKNLIIDNIKTQKFYIILYVIVILLVYPLQNVYSSKILADIYKLVSTNKSIKKEIIQLFIITFIIIILYLYKNKLELKVIPNFIENTRTQLYEKTLNMSQYTDIPIGKYIYHCTRTSTILRDIFSSTINKILRTAVISLTIIIYMIYKFPKIGTLLLLCFIIITYITLNISDVIKATKKDTTKFSEVNENLQDSLSNFDNILLNMKSKDEVDRIKRNLSEHTKLSQESYDEFNKFYFKYMSVLFVSFVLIYYTVFKEFKSTNFILISILIMLFYNNQLNFITTLFEYIQNLGQLSAEADFFKDIFNEVDDGSIDDDTIDFGNIVFDNIKFSFKDKNIYNNYSLKINRNDKLLITGKFGRGKSTLMKLLVKLYKLDDGDILISSHSIKHIKTSLLRRKIIYVNQKTTLFNDTIINNIKYGNDSSDERIIEILKKYNFYNQLKDKLYTKTRMNELSLGMQKVIIILRGILKDGYDTIIFDEPTVSLDVPTKESVLKMIFDVCNDKTVIIISHDPDVEKYCDRIENI